MSLVHCLIAAAQVLGAQSPMRIQYILSVDSTTAPDFRVEMRVPSAQDTIRLAMAAHPEYDDRYWRYLRDLTVQSDGKNVPLAREDSAIWRVAPTRRDIVVRYRVTPPTYEHGRGSWQAYLSPTGGLLGGPHSFLYVIGHEAAPSLVTVHLPPSWRIATGLDQVSDTVYSADSVGQLLDNPILVGHFARCRFTVAGVPHDVVYAGGVNAAPFDTAALVSGLERLAEASHGVFHHFPFPGFVFLLEEGAYGGGLEHERSVTLGISASDLTRAPAAFFSGAAHEYVHVWNEVHLRPRGWGGVTTRPATHTRELWWMEGVTMYYSDVLARRAHLPTDRPSRAAQLAYEIGTYLDHPSNARVSPEEASWWSGDAPGSHGDLVPDYYLQGRLLGAMLDLVVRDSTANRRSLDDVMRILVLRDGGHGYTGADIQRAAEQACDCALHEFFDTEVRRAHDLDFDRFLSAAGLRTSVVESPAVDSLGRGVPDLRVGAYPIDSDAAPRLLVSQPDGIWARAGLRTGDVVRAWNGARPAGAREFRGKLRALRLGDTVTVQVERAATSQQVVVPITGYATHVVQLLPVAMPTERQRRVRGGALLDSLP